MFFNVIAKGCRAFFSTATGVKRGLEEFFEAGKALPVSPKEGQKKPVYGKRVFWKRESFLIDRSGVGS